MPEQIDGRGLVHVKDSAMQDRPLCGFESGAEPMAWTTRTSAEVMATCADCLTEVLRDKCTHCDGNRWISNGCSEEGCCGQSKCYACDGEEFIEQRDAALKSREAAR